MNIYDALTGVLQQSLPPPETVTKIQASPDGSTLFFAHPLSVTMWDVQTGGLIHTFTTLSEVNDIAVSTSGDCIACGSSDGSVRFWNTHTKQEGKGFRNGQPVISICWPSPQKLAVATKNSFYIYSVTAGETMDCLSFPDCVWGMVYLVDKDEFLVGTSRPGSEGDWELSSFEIISHQFLGTLGKGQSGVDRWWLVGGEESPMHLGELTHPMIVGKEIVCITPPNGVQLFNTESYNWTNNPPVLGGATSVAVSLTRNLVVQMKDSIQIFSTDILASCGVHNDAHQSHVYPLGKKHILCILQATRHLILLELETLRELHHNDDTLPFGSLLPNKTLTAHTPPCPGLVGKFDLSVAMQAWRSGTPLPEWTKGGDDDWLLYGLSPSCTKMVVVCSSGVMRGTWVKDAVHGGIVASLARGNDDLGNRGVYDITFDESETRFYLKIDRPGQHIQVPYDITPSPSGPDQYMIIKGEPALLSEPRATPPYALDANCEWVLDAQSRKICCIPPGNVRRGKGGHFWAGTLLVMVGVDGIVRKVSFNEPDCWGIHNVSAQ